MLAAIGHDRALRERQLWTDVDVVLLDAADEGRAGDHFPGVGVVRHIRSNAGDSVPTVVVVTGHFFDDGLRHRMAEVGADFFFLRPEIRSSEKLIDIVLNPKRYRRGVPEVSDKVGVGLLGITGGSVIEGFVGYVEANELEATLNGVDRAGASQSRRSLLRHRKGLAKASGIETLNISTGFPPGEFQKSPSMRQVRKIWAWAARVKYSDRDSSVEHVETPDAR